MAAKFEIYILSKKYLSIKICQTIFPNICKIQFSEKCIVWDDWLPAKEDVVCMKNDNQIQAYITNNQIVQFYGIADSYTIGARQYFENALFCTELWIDTSYFPELDTNIPNEFCKSFCQSMAKNILDMNRTAEIKFFAMGTEMTINCYERLAESVKRSNGIMCYWHEEVESH